MWTQEREASAMEHRKPSPKKCPECDSTKFKESSAAELFSEGIPPRYTGFRCERGHVFMAERSFPAIQSD